MVEGNEIQSPGGQTKKSRYISFILIVGKEIGLRPDTI